MSKSNPLSLKIDVQIPIKERLSRAKERLDNDLEISKAPFYK